ncbi:hypothetical protein ACFWNK_13650 [Streptomyces sp. NPDC058417]|uniref:hypothetical protein n=1 Tax=unclassified Streptomyces TaxID=2593676 RepID=UPI003653C71B
MTASALPGYAFHGLACAHRLTIGVMVHDQQKWRTVLDIRDERLHSGAPLITLVTDGPSLYVRPAALVRVRADEAPAPCERHRTPQPLTGLPTASSSASAPEGGR